MAKQESIGFNTKDTLRWKQALRGAYAIVCLKCWYTSKLTHGVPDQLLYHETIRFKGTSKPFKIILYITCI